MQKIGVNKSKQNNREHFTTLKESRTINFKDSIEEINSIIIKPLCINIDLIKVNDNLRLTLKTDIKVIYLKKDDSSMYVYKDTCIDYVTIQLPKILEGHYLYDVGLIKKFKHEIFVENINTKLLNNKLLLSYFITITINVSPTHYISYAINNGFCDNVFLSHINGHVLTQKTFNQNMNCNKIEWSLDGSKVCYLATIDNKENIYCLNNTNNNVNIIENVNIFEIIIDFTFKNANEIIINASNEHIHNLYCFNLKRNQLKKLTNQEYGYINSNPYYSTKDKLLYFLSGDEKIKYLYSLDEKNNIHTIFNYINVIDYYVSCYSNNLLLKVYKDNKLSLFILDSVSKFLNPLPIQIPYDDILDVKFLDNDEDRRKVLILIKNSPQNNKENSLILYDLNNYNCRILLQDTIKKIDIDYITSTIFLINIKNNLNYVEKITIEKLLSGSTADVILKLPVSINDISIKRVVDAK